MKHSSSKTLPLLSCALLGAIVVSLSPGQAFAQESTSPAYVDMQELFQNYYKTVTYQQKLGKERDELRSKAEDLQKEVKELGNQRQKLAERLQNPGLSDKARKEAQQKMETKQNILQAKQQEMRQFMDEEVETLKQKYKDRRNEIVQEIQTVIQDYAEEENIELVLDVSGMTSNMLPTVLHYPEEKELTDEILDIMNEGHEDEVKEAENMDMPFGEDAPTAP